MTSSLVGSEMCIRDSESTQETSWVGQLQHAQVLLVEVKVKNNNRRIMPCLLYTSDAADDM
eukprot:8620062-Prorocentrum_lima.AAC.1